MTAYSQPPLPESVRTLTDDEIYHLDATTRRKWLEPSKTCLTCRKENRKEGDPATYRWFAPDSRETVVDWECNCIDQYRLYRWMQYLGLGLKEQRLSWDDQIDLDRDAFRMILEWTKAADWHIANGTNLMLHSPQPGPGKTFLMVMLAKDLMSAGYEPYFATWDQILNQYTEGWRNDERRVRFDARVRSAQILMIDDLGREHPGRHDVAIAALDSLLRSRTSDCLSTAFTTNRDINDLGYGLNVGSLLTENMIPCLVKGVDKRPLIIERNRREAALRVLRPIVWA